MADFEVQFMDGGKWAFFSIHDNVDDAIVSANRAFSKNSGEGAKVVSDTFDENQDMYVSKTVFQRRPRAGDSDAVPDAGSGSEGSRARRKKLNAKTYNTLAAKRRQKQKRSQTFRAVRYSVGVAFVITALLSVVIGIEYMSVTL